MTDALRVVIADDSAPFRDGLRVLLEMVDDIEVVGEAATGEDAVALAVSVQPDVVVMDVTMPGAGGIDSTRALVEAAPHVPVLVLTMSDEDDVIAAALQAGARGYVVKGTGQAGLLQAIRGVGAGGVALGSSVAGRLAEIVGRGPDGPRGPFRGLTAREREVLDAMARGWSNAQIAAHFALSGKTVRNHVSAILGKLAVTDRGEAIMQARAAGFGKS